MTFTPAELDRLLDVARAATAIGCETVRAGFGAAHTIAAKGPGDWVSEVDTASERAVREALTGAVPEIAVFGEEEGGTRAEIAWFVDPLDGTANFVHGFPVVGVSVGLVAAGEPVVGVVAAPFLGDEYWARRGGGAFRNGIPLRVSGRPVESAIVATGFPFRAKRERLDEYLPVFDVALHTFEDLRRAGAASLDLAWTAAGVFDGYFEQRLGPWDVAAGALVVREAGGVVTDWQGDERAWLESGDVIAAPPAVHARVLDLVAAAASGREPGIPASSERPGERAG
jgi:myo-inositol-1(or 4)-monophosphatase